MDFLIIADAKELFPVPDNYRIFAHLSSEFSKKGAFAPC